MPKAKTPSLIGSTLGRPIGTTCGRLTRCSRCRVDIRKGDQCYDIPQLRKPHSATRRFCAKCFVGVLEQTKRDLEELCRASPL